MIQELMDRLEKETGKRGLDAGAGIGRNRCASSYHGSDPGSADQRTP